jgi:hypothetical protein
MLENLRRAWTVLKYTHSLTLRELLEPHEGHTVPESQGVTSSHKDKPTQGGDGSDLQTCHRASDVILEGQECWPWCRTGWAQPLLGGAPSCQVTSHPKASVSHLQYQGFLGNHL